MIDTQNLDELRKIVQKKKIVLIRARDSTFNRKALEIAKNSTLVSPEIETSNSFKQLDSGINHVLATIATKNDNSIGINFEEIRSLTRVEKGERLAKIRQNIQICRKANTRLASRGTAEAFYILLSLGASTDQAKKAVAQSF